MAILGRGHSADFGTLPQHRARGFTRSVIGAATGVCFALETVLAGVVFLIGTATLLIGCAILAFEVFLPLLVDSEPRRLPAMIGAATALLGGVVALTSVVVGYRSACRLR
jgi:cyanate permease